MDVLFIKPSCSRNGSYTSSTVFTSSPIEAAIVLTPTGPPSNFNISVRSLLDRFVDDESQSAYLGNNAKKIFDSLSPLHNLDDKYKFYGSVNSGILFM